MLVDNWRISDDVGSTHAWIPSRLAVVLARVGGGGGSYVSVAADFLSCNCFNGIRDPLWVKALAAETQFLALHTELTFLQISPRPFCCCTIFRAASATAGCRKCWGCCAVPPQTFLFSSSTSSFWSFLSAGVQHHMQVIFICWKTSSPLNGGVPSLVGKKIHEKL